MPDHDHDLVLYGATGFTGALVAEHLAATAPEGFRWALAGRNLDKLARVRDGLAAVHPRIADVPLLQADSGDEASLEAMAASTRVVVSTVGPYLRYGLPLVAACAKHGTAYCDLTGEVPFMQRSRDAFHDEAARTGARIVHACGYDSVPSDLGTLLLQDAMTAAGGPATRATTIVGPSRGGVSGGTLASMAAIVELAGEDREARRRMAHPYALDPEDDRGTADTWDPTAPAWRDDVGQWVAPFFMAPVNTRVVRRSHALLGRPWGEDFSYTEVIAMGAGLRGRATAWGVTAGLGAFVGAMAVPPLAALLDRVLPSPGEGPAEETREAGFFRHLVVGHAADPAHDHVARVVGHKDPGYGCTAVMLGQAGLALALDAPQDAAGVLTPAVALGLPYLDRLRAEGMTWEASAWPSDGPPRP